MAIVLLCKRCRSILKRLDQHEGWFCDECDQVKMGGEQFNQKGKEGDDEAQ